MLAKPEYSSPPDEVCCWPGRRGGATAERRSRGRAAGWGAAAELAGRGAVAKMLMPGRSIGKRGKKHARRKSSIGKNMHLSFQMNKI